MFNRGTFIAPLNHFGVAMDDWILTHYWYLVKINPQANEKKYYTVYIVKNKTTGMYFFGTQHGRIGSESTGGTFRGLKSYSTEDRARNDAVSRVTPKLQGGYSTGTVTVLTVLVEVPGHRYHLDTSTASITQSASTTPPPSPPPAAPTAAPEVPAMLQELWLATEVDGNAFVSYSLVRGDGWLIPYKRELVLREGVQKRMFDVHKDERGIAQVRCVVEHPGGGLAPSITAVSAVLSYEPGEKNLHLCSIDQLLSQ